MKKDSRKTSELEDTMKYIYIYIYKSFKLRQDLTKMGKKNKTATLCTSIWPKIVQKKVVKKLYLFSIFFSFVVVVLFSKVFQIILK